MESSSPRYEQLYENQQQTAEDGQEDAVEEQFQLPYWLAASSTVICTVLSAVLNFGGLVVLVYFIVVSLQKSTIPITPSPALPVVPPPPPPSPSPPPPSPTPSPPPPPPSPPPPPPSPPSPPPPPPSPPPPPPSPPPPPPPYACTNPLALRCDYEALVSFRQSISGDFQSWTGSDPCNAWKGVLCSEVAPGNNRVTGLNLGKGLYVYDPKDKVWVFKEGQYQPNWDYNMGTPNVSLLADMPFLQLLAFDNCNVNLQQLPSEISSLSNLQTLDLQNNNIKGTLPAQFSTWNKLQLFTVNINEIKGSLPKEYSTWGDLKFGLFGSNSLTGTLPPDLSAWTSPQQVDFSTNSFSGSLPPQYTVWLDSLSEFFSQNEFNDLPCATLATQTAFRNKLGTKANNDIFNLQTCPQQI